MTRLLTPFTPNHPLLSRRTLARCGALLLSLGLTWSCASEKDEPITSSQTHWLKKCDTTADCGSLSCECGVCTQSCDESDACGGLSDDAVCAPTEGVSACGSTAASQICLDACSDDDDCGSNTQCDDGVCVLSDDGSDDGSGTDEPTDTDDSGETDISDMTDGEDPAATDDPAGTDEPTDTDDPEETDVQTDDLPMPPINDGPAMPAGIMCAEYTGCDALTPCSDGSECIAFSECGGGICIDYEEACDLSCPSIDECLLAESFPAQLFCDDQVRPTPGEPSMPDEPGDDPPGIQCGDYPACDDGCNDGAECFSIPGCGEAGDLSSGAICIDPDEACALTCPQPEAEVCEILESFPAQLGCEGAVPGTPADSGSDSCALECTPGETLLVEDCQCVPCPPIACEEGTEFDDSCECVPSASGPSGVQCLDYPECSVQDNNCAEGADCISITGCDSAICIAADAACAASCPDPQSCVLMESFPLQIGCDGFVEADPDGGGSSSDVELSDLNSDCIDDACPAGLTPVTYFGIAGPQGPEFCSCSIPCADSADVCPTGSICATIADGPGTVCVAE